MIKKKGDLLKRQRPIIAASGLTNDSDTTKQLLYPRRTDV
uniref:Uncharacterized protein n=1 Tax=Anguilla anguilla TaxID=7936 RepID=A0A0E9RRK8_ANGAN